MATAVLPEFCWALRIIVTISGGVSGGCSIGVFGLLVAKHRGCHDSP